MDHDDQTIGRIFTRREAMAAVAGTALAMSWGRSLRATTPAATRPATLVATPQVTEGPFFVDERLNRSDLVTGTDRPAVARGMPMVLTIAVQKLVGGTTLLPMAGATVDLWHADAHGVYSDEDHPMNAEVTSGQRWLRGCQVTDATGRATFRTIVPGWYESRAPHVHFKVRQLGAATPRPTATAEFTSQLFFVQKQLEPIYAAGPYAGRGRMTTTNADDDIYNDRLADGTPAGAALTLDLRDDGAGGRSAGCQIYLTDASLRGGERRGGRSGPGGPDGGPPPDDGFWW